MKKYIVTGILKSPVVVQGKVLYEGLVVELEDSQQVEVLKEIGALREVTETEQKTKKKEDEK